MIMLCWCAGDWVEQYLIAHCNGKVRNSASFLLVSLVPNTHFRLLVLAFFLLRRLLYPPLGSRNQIRGGGLSPHDSGDFDWNINCS